MSSQPLNHAERLIQRVADLLGAPVEEIYQLDLQVFNACLLYLFGRTKGIDI